MQKHEARDPSFKPDIRPNYLASECKWIEIEDFVLMTEPVHVYQQQQNEYFYKKRQEYILKRLSRKKAYKLKKQIDFGSSSSYEEELQPKMGQPQNILNKLYPYDVLGTAKSLNSTKSNSLSKLSDHDRVCVLLLSKKGQNNWLDEVLTFREIGLELPSLTIPYEDISKVKLIFEPVNEEFFKIKITALEQETLIAAAGYTGNCLHFYIFARILNAKLDLKGKKPAQLPAPSSEVPAVIMKNSLIYGNLLKKSRFLGWKEVFVAIGKDGLYCYKKLGDDGSLLIPRGTIKYLWSRFEIEREMVVIKMFQDSSKIEFGIPVSNFVNQPNWLYHFYYLHCRND